MTIIEHMNNFIYQKTQQYMGIKLLACLLFFIFFYTKQKNEHNNQIAWLSVHNWEDTVCSFHYNNIWESNCLLNCFRYYLYKTKKLNIIFMNYDKSLEMKVALSTSVCGRDL